MRNAGRITNVSSNPTPGTVRRSEVAHLDLWRSLLLNTLDPTAVYPGEQQ